MLRLMFVVFAMVLNGCVALQMGTMGGHPSQKDNMATALSDPSPQVRRQAVEELGEKGDPASVDLLRKSLNDPDPGVREAIALALREAGDAGREAGGDLLAALQMETNASAAVEMGWTLYRWDTDLRPAHDSLLRVMKQKDDARSRYHGALLSRAWMDVDILVPVYVDTLGTQVAKDARNKPDNLIVELIPEHGKMILPLLVSAATNNNPAARAAIAHLLYQFKPKPDPVAMMRQLMANPSADVHSSVLPAEAEKLLLKLMTDIDRDVREAAMWSAGMCQPAPNAAGPLLLKAMTDTEENVRAAAVGSIGPLVAQQRAPAGSLDAMAKLLNDPSNKVRGEAALALAHIGDLSPEVTRLLTARVDTRVEPDATVRAMAAGALGRGAKIPELRTALLLGLRDNNETVVERSLASIGHSGTSDQEILSEVSARITSAYSKGVRLTALGTLRDLGPAATPVRASVQAVQADQDRDIREAATEVLARMNDEV